LTAAVGDTGFDAGELTGFGDVVVAVFEGYEDGDCLTAGGGESGFGGDELDGFDGGSGGGGGEAWIAELTKSNS
jgi:hypothetical protein